MIKLTGLLLVGLGFIHVPFLPGRAGRRQASLPLAMMTEAVGTAVAVALGTRRDRRRAGGATH